MGVSLDHWRGSIGTNHGKYSHNNTCKKYPRHEEFYIKRELRTIWSKVTKSQPVQIILGLFIVFTVR